MAPLVSSFGGQAAYCGVKGAFEVVDFELELAEVLLSSVISVNIMDATNLSVVDHRCPRKDEQF